MNTKSTDTKSSVLKALEQHKGSSVSGSSIAAELGISRNSVWKAVTALRQEGHLIEGSGGGYILSTSSDMLSAEGISGHLDACADLVVLDSVDSTNKEAGRLAIDDFRNPTIIVANSQTEGRGRLGRSFYSPADLGLYMSFLIKPNISLQMAPKMTIAASVAVAKAIENISGITCGIKWVNDIYIDDKKVCGILTEAAAGMETNSLRYLITGIGVNCHPQDFPEMAGDSPGWIPKEVTRNRLAAEIANRFLPLTDNPLDDDILEYYRSHSTVLGEEILIYNYGRENNTEGVQATALGIDHNGGLMVSFPGGRKETLTSGEISIRKGKGNEQQC